MLFASCLQQYDSFVPRVSLACDFVHTNIRKFASQRVLIYSMFCNKTFFFVCTQQVRPEAAVAVAFAAVVEAVIGAVEEAVIGAVEEEDEVALIEAVEEEVM